MLTWLYNTIVYTESIPYFYKRGLIVPIPKAGKDQSYKDNNRGITLLPTIYKLFEKILLYREKAWLSDNNVRDDIQGAAQEQCSSQHTSMLLQKVI